MQQETPNFRSIAELNLIAALIEGHAQDARGMVQSMRNAQRPAALDDVLVERVERQYKETAEFVLIYDQQLARWSADSLDGAQTRTVERLKAIVRQLDKDVAEVLSLAAAAKKITIDAINRMSDIELGLATLLGEFPAPTRRR
jgi:hypothetical protein